MPMDKPANALTELRAQIARLTSLLVGLNEQDNLLIEDMNSRSPAGFSMP